MKIALITDTHWGARSDNIALMDYFKKFLDNVFFPYLSANHIDTVIHLGDLVDRRKYLNINTANRLHTDFLGPLRELVPFQHFIAGNHDCYFKNTNSINVLHELGVWQPHVEPTEFVFDGCKILFVPWMCAENEEATLEAIKNTKAQVCFGHLELKGFEMHKGSFSEYGHESDVFSKFDIVASGHFHHKSTYQNINYLGAPWEISWADYGDTKGFHVFDTATRELTFVENPYKLFNKVHYDDDGKSMEEVLGQDLSRFKDAYVKVIVKSKSNPYWFDQFIQRLEELPVLDVQSVDDHLNLSLESDDDIIDQAESTVDILKKSIGQLGINESYQKPLEKLLHELYHEANLMNV